MLNLRTLFFRYVNLKEYRIIKMEHCVIKMNNVNLITKRFLLSLVGGFFLSPVFVSANPQVLVTNKQHADIVKKVQTVKWAKNGYQNLKNRVDTYVAKTAVKPDWLTSRLAMNWQTHYTRAITKDSRTVGGEGRAPVPTPRFAGARDWKTKYYPTDIAGLKPYNDRNGLVQLVNKETGKYEWVKPSITGHTIEKINGELMQLAADAAFVYWITGDVKYAEFSAPILWTYMEGFSYVKPPLVPAHNKKLPRIIGLTSYEVIHEGILESISISYDFLRDYIADKSDIDGNVIETGIKRIVEVVAAGGGRKGNWNLHQASKMTYGALALGSDKDYKDGKGRQHYVDIILNADLPQQLGLTHVIKQGYDPKTAIWAEAPGYAFDTTANIIEVASLLSNDKSGRKVLEDPIVKRAVINQLRQMYPNGASHGMGDTSYTRVNTHAVELMLSWSLKEGDMKSAAEFSAILKAEMLAGKYSREDNATLFDIINYTAELPKSSSTVLKQTSTYFAEPLNLVMLQDMPKSGDINYALGATMLGTKGGHVHTNGLSTELYGAGHVLGVDSGRGTSYWQKDHGQYYRTLPSHNTVIPNGKANYPSHGEGTIAMQVQAVEPAFDDQANGKKLTYVTSSFEYKKPAATQQRTLALVRVNETTAFYFDVFRSRLNKAAPDEYHDWLYHGMADSIEFEKLSLKSSSELTSTNGNMEGYDYFDNEASAKTDVAIHARFPLKIDSDNVAMDVWLLGGEGRTVFAVDAPANRAARHSYKEKDWNKPTPTLVIRQQGSAWNQPFVSVYEPSLQAENVKIQSVEAVNDNVWRVNGKDWHALLSLNGVKLDVNITHD